MNNAEKEFYGESHVYEQLIANGIKVFWNSLCRRSLADFTTENGITIDVKFATPHLYPKYNSPIWRFNLHHHGKKQTGIDYFICVLESKNKPLMFVFPASLVSGYQITISERQLNMGKYNYFLENWNLIKQHKPKGDNKPTEITTIRMIRQT